MCGIAGILQPDGSVAVHDAAVQRMRCAIRHRGPDDEGTWSSTSGQAAFAHTRLAILDLSPAGHQPMSSPDGRFTITFNGEIYNFLELRRALEQRGACFYTRTDTEVILRAYELDGPACLLGLRGMFAMAIWDERERTCLLARDRFGIKPLYYSAANGRVIFASEVNALLGSGLMARELDPDGLFGYFLTGTVPEPHTLVRGVRCLEAGSYAIWKGGAITARRFWDLQFGQQAVDESVEATRRSLIDSVAHHFVSDAPVGIFLSGGMDSTALVALARLAGHNDLHTFSLSFPGDPDDEGVIASETAFHFGTHHAEWAIDADTGRELFSGFQRAGDQPSIDGLNTYAVSKFARQHGMKVVLSGIGSDELFGGYPSFDWVPRMARWNRRLAAAGPLRKTAGRRIEQAAGDPRWRRFGDLLTQPADLVPAYETFRGVYTHAEARALVEQYTGRPYCGPSAAESVKQTDPNPRDMISRLELARYLRNQTLRDGDTMSMAWGLELRVPFLDGPLVDTLSAIPAATRLEAGKRLLFRSVPEIPSWVTAQPKRGFMFPFKRWLDDEWREVFDEINGSGPVSAQTWYQKWALFVLNRWIEQRRAK